MIASLFGKEFFMSYGVYPFIWVFLHNVFLFLPTFLLVLFLSGTLALLGRVGYLGFSAPVIPFSLFYLSLVKSEISGPEMRIP